MKKRVLFGAGSVAAALFLILLVAFVSVVAAYNDLVRRRNAVEREWSNVEVQYQRRADLIPRLVSAVAGIAQQEREVYESVAALRAGMTAIEQLGEVDPSDPHAAAAFMAAQQQLSQALFRLRIQVEAYPELTSQQNFIALQAQIEGTENRIAVARRDYNAEVTEYRNAIGVWPKSMVAMWFGFKDSYPLFEADDEAHTAPDIDFSMPPERSPTTGTG